MTPESAHVLLILGGGIAAYKGPALVRAFRAAGAEVRVVRTASAGAFVSDLALASVSGHAVRSQLLDVDEEGAISHIDLARWADQVVVAPATANLIARAAHGLADDLATTVLLATRAPVLWCPAMNTAMLQHPATVANIATLTQRAGHRVLAPDAGGLACGESGEGRMPDPESIVAFWQAFAVPRYWSGKRVVVSAGATRSYVDPVRFVSNGSTGAMGFALAAAFRDAGAGVTLVAGATQLPTPHGVTRVDAETPDAMFAALDEALHGANALAMTAAVSDVRLPSASDEKLPKASLLADWRELPWTPTEDLLATLARKHGGGSGCTMLGFAAETVDAAQPWEGQLVERGGAKLVRKGCDWLFANPVGIAGAGMGSPTNYGVLLRAAPGRAEVHAVQREALPKADIARWLVERMGKANARGE